uniref:Uncharacterized protein n=1 Tax=viral metagenome TaxID=1070528 RepID=A0A6C0ANW4_9ZZZZ
MNTAINFLGYNPIEYVPAILVTGKIGLVFFALGALLYSYGAAKLSYTYNMSMNNGSMAYFWCLLCFFFASIYYPYYAIFLNPVLPISMVGVAVGGRRR